MTAIHPLTAFEEYMLHDDCTEQPMTFFLRADLEGELEESILRSTFDAVVRRHPIFWSKIVRKGRTRLAWQPDPTRIPSLTIGTGETMGQCPLESYIDLETEPGIRACVTVGTAKAELWLQFHHSCCDGISGIAFLDEFIATYARTSHGTAPLLPPTIDFPKYSCAYSALTMGERVQRFARDLPRIWTFFCRRLMSPPRSIAESQDSVEKFAHVEARVPLTSSIRARLKRTHQHPASINDILLRDVYLALKDLLEQQPDVGDRGWIRLAIPTNLRQPGEPVRSCRNDMSMAFLDRRIGQFESKAETLQSISQEMTQIKRHRLGHAMLRTLNWLRCAPGGLPAITAVPRSFATTVVSNLGEVFASLTNRGPIVIGNMTIAKLGFLIPTRAGTPLALGALTYADELTLCMQYDSRHIDRNCAYGLLSSVVDYLKDSFAEQPGETTLSPTRRAA